MRLDQALLTLHILAAAIWIGAAFAVQVIAAKMDTDTAGAAVDRFAHDAEVVGKTLFGPASVGVLLTGIALVAREHLRWSQAWIVGGIVAMVAAGAVGGLYLIPEGRRIASLAREPAHDTAEVLRRSKRRLLVARIDLAILVLAVIDMVFRPGG